MLRLFPSSLRHLVWVCLLLATSSLHAASIIVNEYSNSNSTATGGTKMVSDEYIEFVLTESMTVLQLSSLTFGDSDATTSAIQAVFKFDSATLTSALAPSGLNTFVAGTIIVVKGTGLGAQNTSYNPFGNPTSADAWSLELVAGQGALDHSETVINGNLDIAGQGDVIWISSTTPTSKTDTSGFISAIGHDNSPGTIANAVMAAFGSGAIDPSTIGSGKVVYNTAGAVASVTNGTTGSMGTSNGGANSAWLDGVRTATLAPEPSRGLLLFAGAQMLVLKRRRPVGTRLLKSAEVGRERANSAL